MIIMKSCCFFKNVWNGSFASGIYTMIYFAFSSIVLLIYVIDEWDYLMGRRYNPKGETIIEKGDITETHVIFNIIVLICSLGLVASSIIMLYGLRKDKRELLLPWILLMVGDVCVELFYAIYFILSKRANFDPIVGFIFTMDLFIVCLHTYCLLCVVSQYQEYKVMPQRRNQQLNVSIRKYAVPNEDVGNNFYEAIAVPEQQPISIKTTYLRGFSTHNIEPTSSVPKENVSESQL